MTSQIRKVVFDLYIVLLYIFSGKKVCVSYVMADCITEIISQSCFLNEAFVTCRYIFLQFWYVL